MQKKLLLTSCLSFLFFTLPAIAEEASKDESLTGVSFSSTVGFVTDYKFRGISQTDKDAAIQGSIDASHESGFYAGIWGSNVDFNDSDSAHIEVDLYGGYGFSFAGLKIDLSAIYYTYPGASSNRDYDFFEIGSKATYDFDVAAVSTSVNYSPDNFGNSGDAFYYNAGLEVPIVDNLSAKTYLGHQTIDDNAAFGVPDYTHWGLGLAYAFNDFDLSLTYSDTNLKKSECASTCGDSVIVGISRTF